MTKIDSKIPEGPLAQKWTHYKEHQKLVNPPNKRKIDIIVVGTGLAGGAAAASLGEMGFNVKVFCIQDSPRRAHSIAAQGGINAAKNYPNDGDSVYRLFYDTVKGGDYRGREANTYRLAEVSNNIIDQLVAQGVPFAREYSGYLANRSFGGAQVSRTFYARGQTGQQLLLGAYGALSKEIKRGSVKLYTRREMLDLVIMKDGRARGIIVRNLFTGELERYSAHAVLLATGGYGNLYFLSTNAMTSNGSAAWRAYKRGAWFANPCYVQIHPTCIPVHGDYQSKLTLMSESLRNDGRIWVPKKKEDAERIRKKEIRPRDIPEEDRDYYLERRYPAFGNLVPRDVASRAAKERCDAGYGVGTGQAVFLDFKDAIARLGIDVIKARYGNLFDMYERITDDNPYETPMMIYPAIHYTMGGLWVDYELMSNIPGLFVGGEANFSDHGANRLGASALMQGLSDGYFVLPYTMQNYLADQITVGHIPTDTPEFEQAEKDVRGRIEKLMAVKGSQPVDYFHKKLGRIMWDHAGMARNKQGLEEGIKMIQELRKDFWENVRVPGNPNGINIELEKALRVADFLELGELLARDALHREESAGGHFREEYQTPEGEALRNDKDFMYVAAWEYQGDDKEPKLNKEPLVFENIEVKTRNYKTA
jgi:succinate dehydrogenase / fumarate reductase flavoprotein subunit